MGITTSTSSKGMTEVQPTWIRAVVPLPECAQDQMGSMSDGMSLMNPNTVIRHRAGTFHSDGAMWGRGFTSGKHAFEIVYPVSFRSIEAMVGVAKGCASTYAKGKVSLIGLTKDSWGVSLITKRAFHVGKFEKNFPMNKMQLPDKFYMYLDMDGGRLQFASDFVFYGTAHHNIPKNEPIYPMVSAIGPKTIISIRYLGSENLNYMVVPPPAQTNTVVVGPGGKTTIITSTQQQQQQQPQQQVVYAHPPPPQPQPQPLPYQPYPTTEQGGIPPPPAYEATEGSSSSASAVAPPPEGTDLYEKTPPAQQEQQEGAKGE